MLLSFCGICELCKSWGERVRGNSKNKKGEKVIKQKVWLYSKHHRWDHSAKYTNNLSKNSSFIVRVCNLFWKNLQIHGLKAFFQILFSSNNINAFCNRKCLVSYVGMHHIVPPRSIMPCAELWPFATALARPIVYRFIVRMRIEIPYSGDSSTGPSEGLKIRVCQ